jgi:hypothetical protein
MHLAVALPGDGIESSSTADEIEMFRLALDTWLAVF